MEELLLRRDLARDELDIVHEQNVRRTVFVVQLRRRAVLDGGDDLVRERLAVHKEEDVYKRQADLRVGWLGSLPRSCIVYRMRRCTGFRPSRTSGSARCVMTDIE